MFSCLGVGLLVVGELLLLLLAPHVGIAALAAIAVVIWLRQRNPERKYQTTARMASRMLAEGNLEWASKAADRCEQILPGKPVTSGIRGQILYQQNRFSEAVPWFRKGSQSDAERVMLAECLRKTGAFRESLTVLSEAIIDESLKAQTLVIRAANHIELGERLTRHLSGWGRALSTISITLASSRWRSLGLEGESFTRIGCAGAPAGSPSGSPGRPATRVAP